MSERRKEAIGAIPFPRTTSELRRFLGMFNYMRNLIPRYSLLAKPLSAHVNTTVQEWPRSADCFLWRILITVLQTDASTLGVSGSLINRYPNGDRGIGCCLHAFTLTEMKWKIIEQESFTRRIAMSADQGRYMGLHVSRLCPMDCSV